MQPRISHKALLACGILASLTYVVTDIIASLRYPGYNFIDQTISELFAIGVPTSSPHREWVWLSAWHSTVINSGRQSLPSFSCAKEGR